MDKQPVPETMLEAVRQFADPQVAHDFWVQMRWPNGVACPLSCGSVAVAYMPKRRRWYCRDCKGQFTAKTRTIFEDSPIGFDKWLPAIWLIASNRNGISSYEIARGLAVTQKTAWFMLHRIRAAMEADASEPLSGIVEADESYIGGKWDRMSKGRRRAVRESGASPISQKQAVLGIVERKGRVRASYTHVFPRHLDRYLAEQVFRFDERRNADGPRFVKATKGADGKRLTYRELIRK